MSFEALLGSLLKRNSKARWEILGGDGRVLDVNEQEVNHIGQSIPLPPPVTGQRSIISLLDARAKNPSNPEVITISLTVEIPGGVQSGFIIPQARITWGSGGSLNVADVDVVTGTQITVAASLIRVDGIYFQATGSGVSNVRMGANLAYGERPGANVAPGFTLIGGALQGAPPAIFEIPNFARDVTVYSQQADVANGPPIDCKVLFSSLDQPASAATQAFAGYLQNQETAPNAVQTITYPIPGFARTVQVFNTSLLHDAAFVVRFGLAL